MNEYEANEYRAPRQNGGQRPGNVRPRPADGQRRPQGSANNGQRRPAPQKKRKPQKKSHAGLIIFLLLIVALIAGGVFAYVKYPGEVKILINRILPKPQPTAIAPAPTHGNTTNSAFADLLSQNTGTEGQGDEWTGVATGLDRVNVDDLSITPGLDENWKNILLLGADARSNSEPARTDTMMILSINKITGAVKLSSIMRDTAVSFTGHNNVRLNSAFYYGGERLTMKTINEYFGMNIENYVYVDFNGFASIAEILGGTDMDITESEAYQINANVVEQYKILIAQGKVSYETAEAEYYATELHEAGENIHLNGMQTLGYARIRKLDSDYARAERQRKVLNTLMASLEKASVTKLMELWGKCSPFFRTNLGMTECVELAKSVLNRADFRAAEELRLPVAGSYKEEKRNNEAMLYDMDKELNKRELHNFIYAR